mgnify:CR=1 FL=1
MTNTTTFESAGVGDRVWSFAHGWGTIEEIRDKFEYRILVTFDDSGIISFTVDGKQFTSCAQILFWDEIKFVAPKKPIYIPKEDTLVRVKDYPEKEWTYRYSAGYDEDGYLACFSDGATSRTAGWQTTTLWKIWEIVDE